MKPLFEEQARERQGQRTDLEHSGKVAGKFGEARDQAAAAVGVSGDAWGWSPARPATGYTGAVLWPM